VIPTSVINSLSVATLMLITIPCRTTINVIAASIMLLMYIMKKIKSKIYSYSLEVVTLITTKPRELSVTSPEGARARPSKKESCSKKKEVLPFFVSGTSWQGPAPPPHTHTQPQHAPLKRTQQQQKEQEVEWWSSRCLFFCAPPQLPAKLRLIASTPDKEL
jgi:hypothetical protein